jgi:RNA polymerase sigma-70 factor (ECF subfamily)
VAESGKSPERNVRLAALMARIALGDQAAFAELYAQTSSHLYGVAVRILKDGALAEEILQEAFVSVWHHAGSYDAAKSQPSTWLAAVIRNRCLDLMRRRELDTVTMTTDDDDGREFDLPSGRSDARGNAVGGRRRASGARLRGCARCRPETGDRAGVLPGTVARRTG